MVLGRERQFFAGGITPVGFVSFFEDVFGDEEREVYILKGGPGTGKSRMMKKIVKAAIQDGYDVEVIRCSADPDSLDGVRIPDLGKTILDGTAPHVVDMNLPGARDTILNLGDFWNEEKLKRHKKEIITLTAEKKACFQTAVQYIKAANEVQKNIERVALQALSHGKLQQWIQIICDRFFEDMDVSYHTGRMRRMFGTAITSKGIVNTLSTLFCGVKVYLLRCPLRCGASQVLETVQWEARKRGFAVESYRCPMEPACTEHLLIPKLSLAFTTYNDYHKITDCDIFGDFSMDVYYNDFILEPHDEEIKYDRFRVQELLEKAQRSLAKAKKIHSTIEAYYADTMDFPAVDQCTAQVIERLFQ